MQHALTVNFKKYREELKMSKRYGSVNSYEKKFVTNRKLKINLLL
ncbi:hypothetical protein CLOSBL3_11889 [Clostridiaceae bacterium BL-3]|nr:hypothetical protein CLOSBL3_11889 [Clostridiaceae bacterium BL-3]